MFMFRRRRTTNLTKKLLRKRRGALNGPAVADRVPQGSRDMKERDIQELLKELQENQLEMLLRALETRGEDAGNCVLVSRVSSHEPHLLCCQYWRWPEVRQSSELRRLPQCGAANDLVYACCNPFHWSRVFEAPAPPYSRTDDDVIRPEDRAPSELPYLTRNSFESLTTSGESSMGNRQEWCKLAYWEFKQRVGVLLPVEPCHWNVFGRVTCGVNGLSLMELGRQNVNDTEASRKTREKIGLGVTLSREPDGFVWLYNRSEQPVFVHSSYLDGGCPEQCGSPVKVPSDHCLCVHGPGELQTFGWDQLVPHGYQRRVGNPNSIRISFVKGWGRGYSRTEITCCPCWLEILLAPCR